MVFLVLFVSCPSYGETGSYKITWDAITDPDVDVVKVFMSPTSGTYDFDSPVAIITAPVTEAVITGIGNGTWFFLPVAYDGPVQGATCITANEQTETFLTAPGCINGITGEKL